MVYLYAAAAAVIGYLLGAIPFGKIYVRVATGKDIQQVGSGRTGGTNSLRAAGWRVGLTTALSDVLKGMVAVLGTRWVFGNLVEPETLPWLEVASGVSAIIGHNWSIYIGFGGGAGTGPNVGWSSVIWAPMFPTAFMVMLFTLYFLGYASVASMALAIFIPSAFYYLLVTGAISSPAYVVGGILAALIVGFALRGNFRRLLRGEERIVGRRARLRRAREEALANAKPPSEQTL